MRNYAKCLRRNYAEIASSHFGQIYLIFTASAPGRGRPLPASDRPSWLRPRREVDDGRRARCVRKGARDKRYDITVVVVAVKAQVHFLKGSPDSHNNALLIIILNVKLVIDALFDT